MKILITFTIMFSGFAEYMITRFVLILFILSPVTLNGQKFSLDTSFLFFYINTHSPTQALAIQKTPILVNLLKIVKDQKCIQIYGSGDREINQRCYEYSGGGIINPAIGHILIRYDIKTKKSESIMVKHLEKKPFFCYNIIRDFVKNESHKSYAFDEDKFKGKNVKIIRNGVDSKLNYNDFCLDEFSLNNSLIIRQDKGTDFYKSDTIVIFLNEQE